MGYEIVYKYHERLEEGGYNKEETKELKKKVGEPFEDIPLDKCASAITAQLARRDIWITDVEVYEYKKQKLNFRETKGGIIIKNKKFILDGEAIVSQEINEIPPAANGNGQFPHNALVPATQVEPQVQNRRPIKFVTFEPELQLMPEVKKKGMQFTHGKNYPVFAEKPNPMGMGMVYTVWDDRKRELNVSEVYFVPAQTQLFADRELGFSNHPGRGDPKLTFPGEVQDKVPDIRSR